MCSSDLSDLSASRALRSLMSFGAAAISASSFASNAASYGCHAVQVGTVAGLVDVLAATKQIKETCVTVIETDRALSTPNNASWNIPVPEESHLEQVRLARTEYERRGY